MSKRRQSSNGARKQPLKMCMILTKEKLHGEHRKILPTEALKRRRP